MDKHTQFQSTFMRKKNTFQAHGSRRGASLLIALGITTIITLMAIGIATVVVSSLRDSSNLARSNEAYYAAEGALEAGLMDNAQKGAGYSTPADMPPLQIGGAKASYKIQGQVPSDKKYLGVFYPNDYSVPSPGTGTVGNNCDPLHAQLKDPLYFDENSGKYYQSQNNDPLNQFITVNPEDNPCNWNKIEPGQSATIPLYYVDKDGAHNTVGMSSTFILRVRTACPNNQIYCKNSERPKFDIGDGTVDNDLPIMIWQITAVDENNGNNYTLIPFKGINQNKNLWLPVTDIILQSKINNAINFEVLNFDNFSRGYDSNNCFGIIREFLNNKDTTYSCGWSNQKIKKPLFKLSLVHGLVSDANVPIPYLEYQIITDGDISPPPSDAFQSVSAEAFSGSFKENLVVKTAQQAGLFEYVVQQ